MPTFNDVQTLSRSVQGALSTVSGVLGAGGGQGPAAGSWWAQLRPAAYRGIAFGVFDSEIRFGRRNAVHEYPYRETVWVEDMGRAGRRIQIIGFLVGDDAIANRDRLVAAMEQGGDGQLVHPTLGTITVSALEGRAIERRERGRVIELALVFIEAGQRVFPSVVASTGDAVSSAASAADAAASQDFVTAAAASLRSGVAQAKLLANTASNWIRKAKRVANAATNLYNMVGTLSGDFGRFFGGHSAKHARPSSDTTASDLIASGSVSRQAVETAATSLSSAADNISSSTSADYAASTQALAATVVASAQEPGEAIRGFASLAQADASNVAAIQRASDDLFRRTAVIAMARAAASYQPSSYDDAVAIRAVVCEALATEILAAGDQGADATYAALKALRTAVAADLGARGADLATMVTVSTPLPMPALALAQRLYRDPARADELVIEANPVHPAFMPVQFKALSR